MTKKKKIRGQQLVKERLREVKEQSEYLGGLHDSLNAAKATGTEDYTGATGSKFLEKHVAEGQRLDQLRVYPASMKNPPPYITELSKNKAAVEKQRQRLGLSNDQVASLQAEAPRYKSRDEIHTKNQRRKETTNYKNNLIPTLILI